MQVPQTKLENLGNLETVTSTRSLWAVVLARFILAHGNSAAADELNSATFNSVTLREASSCPVQPSSHAVQ